MKYYPKALKQQAFKKFLLGYTPKELAEEFAVPPATIYSWCHTWQKELAGFFTIIKEQRKYLLNVREKRKRVLYLMKKMNLSCKKGSARYYSAAARIKLSNLSDVKIL